MNVKVYSKNQCPRCTSVKMFLKAKGVEFEELNTSENEDYYNEMKIVADNYGFTSMPIVVGDTFEPISGFNPDALAGVFGEL